MNDLDDIGQKIKGKAQQLSGEIKNQTGDKMGGPWDKIKGNVNETIADIKMQNNWREKRKNP
jgi:uncharacterized protein YjbJ (UPF0337 family)